MQVGTGADEQEDDEKEGLELEDAELRYALSLYPLLHVGSGTVPYWRSDTEVS